MLRATRILRAHPCFWNEARALTPDNPLIDQEYAELQLMRGNFDEALKAAHRSNETGPGVGPLCQRNWMTIAWVHDVFADNTASESALNNAERCVLKEKPRL